PEHKRIKELLPAFATDNDEDDDGNFTKWMSSYWGHGADTARSRERKHSFRRLSKPHVDRRASLPTVVRGISSILFLLVNSIFCTDVEKNIRICFSNANFSYYIY
uniref:Leukemia NUP98 fusion partner 1 n=1 Tax=Kryptolebias marmoratus TaxID=37003 RepID=A0A3Q3B5K2_KRYMA